MTNNLIYTLLCTFLFIIRSIKCLTGGNICFNLSTEICCSNFERVNDSCKECEIGFTSKQGGQCLKCNIGWFGEKCSTLCYCLPHQRCDFIDGCVNKSSNITPAANESEELTTVYGHHTVRFKRESTTKNDMIPSNKTHLVTIPIDDRSTADTITTTLPIRISTDNNSPIVTSRELTIYCVAAALLILVMGLCYGYHNRRLKSQNKKLAEVSSSNALLDVISEDIELEDGIYHVIDESKMEDSNAIPSGGYLEVIDSSSDPVIHQRNDGGYLIPYYPSEVQIHDFSHKDKECDNSSSSEANSSLPYTDKQGYFHMYQQLQERSRSLPRDYEYTSHIQCKEKTYVNRRSINPNSKEIKTSISNVQNYQKEQNISGNSSDRIVGKETRSKNQEKLELLKRTQFSQQNVKHLTL